MKKQLCVGIGISMLAFILTASAAQEKTPETTGTIPASKVTTTKKADAEKPPADPKDQQVAQLNSRVVALQQANEALTERLGKIAETSVPANQVGGICKAAIEQQNPDVKLDDTLKIVKK